MEHFMLDLETMGKGSNAAIIAIGAVEFDIEAGIIGDKFYTVIDLESSVKNGGVIDASTVMWWLSQSEEARFALTSESVHIAVALGKFSTWLTDRCDPNYAKVWGNGADFDNVILGSAYHRSDFEQPWKFWNNRCYRTTRALFPPSEMKRVGTHHHALDDAESQALHLIFILKSQNMQQFES